MLVKPHGYDVMPRLFKAVGPALEGFGIVSPEIAHTLVGETGIVERLLQDSLAR